MIAVSRKDTNLLDALIEEGADLNLKNDVILSTFMIFKFSFF